ncbi:MAG: DUF2341 domain-containing protein, partial [Kiritimatiellae bacterium]|nr:DUF2341 domain-containing protein [Kiritimatiellia bacterium]
MLAFVLCLPPVADAAWKAGFGYRKSLTVDADAWGAADLTNFPVLVSVTDSELATTANGGHVANSAGYDIVFTDSDGATPLDHEMERYTGSSGEVVAWVRVPVLTNGVDRVLYVYYGSSAVAGSQERAEDVWTNEFRGVWHLAETSGTVCYDSTSYTNNGIKSLESNPVATNSGLIGGAQYFDGVSSNRVTIGHPASGALDPGTGSWTYGCWVYAEANSGGFDMPWWKGGSSVGSIGYDLEFGTGAWKANVADIDELQGGVFATEPTGVWCHTVAVVDRAANLLRVYFNGAESNTVGIGTVGSLSGTGSATIGASGSGGYRWWGLIDEMRVEAAARSADWIAACYANQSDPAAFCAVGNEQSAPTWQAGYNYRRRLTIGADQVSGVTNLTDFPVLVKLTEPELATTANGGLVANSDGYDIVFTGEDGATRLDHELESYDAAAGAVVAWVRVPVLAAEDETTLYMYWGNAAISVSQERVEDVWTNNFLVVWHLSETPTVDAYAYDSTANGNDGTFQAGMTAGDQVPGPIDGALEYDKVSGDYVTAGTLNVGDAFTLSAWAYPTSSLVNMHGVIASAAGAGDADGFKLYLNSWETSDRAIVLNTGNGTAGETTYSGADAIEHNAWNYVAATADRGNGTASLYRNGAFQTTGSIRTDFGNNKTWVAGAVSGGGYMLQGMLDEVRIASVLRSADWIATVYANQSDPAGFLAPGARETVPWRSGWSYRRALTIDADRVGGGADLADFPVLIGLTDADLKGASAGGRVSSASGYDIIFTTDDGQTQLDHELELYTGSTGELVAWVRVPVLSCEEDTTLYMYYGNPTVSASLEDAAGVWKADYEAVWHFAEESGDRYDSTANANTLIETTGVERAAGRIGYAGDFETTGADDMLYRGDADLSAGFPGKMLGGHTGSMTLSLWMNQESIGSKTVVSKWGVGGAGSFAMNFNPATEDNHLHWYLSDDGTTASYTMSKAGTVTTNAVWYKFDLLFDDAADELRIYLNGVLDAWGSDNPKTFTYAMALTNTVLQFGRHGTEEWPYDGLIDEARVSTVARSAGWIATSYTNELDPAGFVTLGARERTTASWKTGWGFRKPITILGDKVAGTEDLVDFPVLVSLADNDLATPSNGGHVTSTNGYDILFTADDGTTQLDHETEQYTTNGTLVAWVRIPVLDGDENTTIWLYFGNGAVSASQEHATEVWDGGFVAVWHLNNDPSAGGPCMLDSTLWANHGIPAGGMDGNDTVDAAIGKGLDFDGTDDLLNCGTNAGFATLTNDLTAEAWVLIDTDTYGRIVSHHAPSSLGWFVARETPDAKAYVGVSPDGTAFNNKYSAIDVWQTVTWYHIAARNDGSYLRLYLNGAEHVGGEFPFAYSAGLHVSTGVVQIGHDEASGGNVHFDGLIDEVRLSRVARSADWLATCYTNQVDPAGFMAIGAKAAAAATWKGGWGYRKPIALESDLVKGTTNLVDFPVVIDLADDDLATTANGGHVTSAAGYDILFTAADGTTALDHEIESYATNGTLTAWVRVPVLDCDDDTRLWMYFGNSSITGTLERPEDVWTNSFLAVWHLSETPTVDPYAYDSTANGHDCTFQAGLAAGDQVTGQLNGAVDPDDGTDDYWTAGAVNVGDAFTLSLWLDPEPLPGGSRGLIANCAGDGTANGFKLYMNTWETTNRSIVFATANGSVSASATSAGGVMVPNTWNQVVVTADRAAGSADLYHNGAFKNNGGIRTDFANNATLTMASVKTGGWLHNGTFDEMRISSVLRSADWIATEYASQSTPAGFAVVGAKEAAAASWDSGWGYRRALTIDGDKVSGTENLVDFPVLISLADPALATTANGGYVQHASGYDIMFTAADGTTQLDHEVEKHELTTGELVAWVRIPVLDCDGDTLIYMYWGNGAISSPRENPTGVWDANYVGVWHMTETNAQDSTHVARHGTAQGGLTDGLGHIDGAVDYDGIDGSWIAVPHSNRPPDMTLEAWIKTPPADTFRNIMGWRTTGGETHCCEFRVYDTGLIDYGETSGTGGTWTNFFTVSTVEDDTWHYACATRTAAGEVSLYVDGAFEASAVIDRAPTTTIWRIGARRDEDYSWLGTLDEVRVSDTARTAAWLATSYTNQLDPAGFCTASAPEASGGFWASGYQHRKKLTIDADRIGGSTDLTDFPVLVSLTDPDLATPANGGYVTSTNGYDIVFTASDGVTPLDHELELYRSDPSNPSDLVAWVRIPVLACDRDTEFYVYFGNSSISDSQENATNVWDADYVGVWHLKEDPSAGTAADSSRYANHGTATDFESADATNGIIGGAVYANADAEDIDCGSEAELDNITNVTIEAWINPNNTWPGLGRIAYKGGKTLYHSSQKLYYYCPFTGSTPSGGEKFRVDSPLLSAFAWQHVAVTFDDRSPDNMAAMYIDGIDRAAVNTETSSGTGSSDAASTLYLLNHTPTGTDEAQAAVDELRISRVIRSADWLATGHTNQVDPAGFVSVAALETTANPSWKTGYGYRKKITLRPDAVYGTTNLVNFPALVSLTDSALATTANGGHVEHASGYDMLLTSADGTTVLDHEVEQYTAASGALVAWVRVPVLDCDDNTVLYLYYGNASISSSRENKAGVWDAGYRGVWHMAEDPSGAVLDSTVHTNHGGQQGGMAAEDLVSGRIGPCLEFDGADDYLDCGQGAGLADITDAITMSAWVRLAAPSNAAVLARHDNGDYGWVLRRGDTGELRAGISPNGSTWYDPGGVEGVIGVGEWHHIAVTYDGNLMRAYANAAEDTGAEFPYDNAVDGIHVPATPLLIACEGYNNSWCFPGLMDEVRLSSVARSLDWLATAYTNQANPAAFLATAAEETAPATAQGAGWADGYRYRKALTIDADAVCGTENLLDFPALVSLTDADLATTANGGYVCNTNGYDILFTAADGTTQLDHELEAYRSDPTDPSDLAAWVRIPVLSASANTVIYLYYGNPNVVTSQERATNVWDSGFMAVWHLAEDPDGAAPQIRDSTAYANHGNVSNLAGGQVVTSADTPIGKGLGFPGTNAFVDVSTAGAGNSLDISTNRLTLEGWGWHDPAGVGDYPCFFTKGPAYNDENYQLGVWEDGVAVDRFDMKINYGDASPPVMRPTVSNAVPTGTWFYAAACYDGTNVACYLNGTEITNAPYAENVASDHAGGTNDLFYISRRFLYTEGAGISWWLGQMDELRVSDVGRSAGWVQTCYTNAADPASFLSAASKETTTNTTWKSGYLYRKKLTIDGGVVSGTNNLVNFPALISLTDSDLRTAANGGKLANANGYDVIFTDVSGVTRLDHEVEKHTLTGGEFVGWVRIPVLDCDADTVIYMYYGNASVDASQEDAAGVWDDDYDLVMHLAETSGTNYADSTRHAHHGSQTLEQYPTPSAGVMAGGQAFDGATNSIYLGDNRGFVTNGAGCTFSTWMFMETTDAVYMVAVSITNDLPTSASRAQINTSDGGRLRAEGRAPDAQASLQNELTVDPAPTGAWVHVAGVTDVAGDDIILYVNGTARATTGAPAFDGELTQAEPARCAAVGAEDTGAAGFFQGLLDEVRISRTARSAHWIATCHTNQAAPADFFSAASEESAPAAAPAGWASGYRYRRLLAIEPDHVLGTADLTNFPALIGLTDGDLAGAANGGYVTSANGYDIIFTSADGTTQLDHELETYTAASGELVAWVRIPVLACEDNTVLYMYYGNPDVTTSQENVTNVWDANYLGVWHLNETTGAICYDSTANAHDATKHSATEPAPAAGQVDGAQDYDGVNADLTLGDILNSLDAPVTIEGWLSKDDTDATFLLATDNVSTDTLGIALLVDTDNTISLLFGDGGGMAENDKRYVKSADLIVTGEWTYIAGAARTLTDMAVFINGLDAGGAPAGSGNNTVHESEPAAIGKWGGYEYDGIMDEVRLSDIARSAGWLATCHTNQADPAGFLAGGGKQTTTNTSWRSGYLYRKRLTIDANAVSGTANLADYPALVSLTDADLRTVSNGGKVESASGYDILFTDVDGTTRLDHEVESYTASSGAIVHWVRIPVLDCDADTVLYMYYGNSAVGGSQENAAGVWAAGYLGVWHMAQSPAESAPQVLDSTTNDHRGTCQGDMDGADLVAARIGRGLEFDGGDDWVDVGAVVSNRTTFTISTWFKTTSTQKQRFWSEGYSDAGSEHMLSMMVNERINLGTFTTGDVSFAVYDGITWYEPWYGPGNNGPAYHDGEWHQAVGVRAGGDYTELYVDGISRGARASVGTALTLDWGQIGCLRWKGGAAAHFTYGQLDEMRLADVARSAGWIATAHTNMAAPGDFLSAASEEAQPPAETSDAAWAAGGWLYRKQVTISADTVSGTSDLTNFPALVSLTDPDLATTAHGGYVRNTNGYDIMFTAEDGTTQLDHEVELYRSDQPDQSDVSVVAWVRVPVLSGEEDTVLWMYYGNASIDASQENATNVWDEDYVMVLHLRETAGDTNYDATTYGNDGYLSLGTPSANGLIAGAAEFADAGEIMVSDDSSLENMTGLTVSFWSKPDSPLASTYNMVRKDGWDQSFYMHTWDQTEMYWGIGVGDRVHVTACFYADAWQHTALRFVGGSEWRVYYNGVSAGSGAAVTPAISNSVSNLHLAQDFDGLLDEVRISKIARSADWIATEYTNQLAPSAFLTTGTKETSADASWQAGGWGYRKKITISADSVPGTNNLVDFPALVSVTDSALRGTASGGRLQNENGYDLIFTSADGTTRLDHEIERYVTGTGEFIGWVRVPTLDCDADTVLYMYYANASVNTPRENPAGVWDADYVGVWHMGDTNAAGELADSTAGAHPATDVTSAQVTGRIAGAHDFTCAGYEHAFVTNTAFATLANEVTISLWQNGEAALQPSGGFIFYSDNGSDRILSCHLPFSGDANVYFDANWLLAGNEDRIQKAAAPAEYEGQWNHWVFTKDAAAGTMRMYLNGAEWHSELSGRTRTLAGITFFRIAGSYDGSIDEFRVSDVERAPAWIAASYTNQAAPSDFFGMAAEESAPSAPGGSWASGYRYRKALVIEGDKVSGGSDLTDFPALIGLTDPDLAGTAYGGFVTSTNGYDIIFTAEDGTTQLDHELEFYRSDPTDQTDPPDLVAWVRIPTLSATDDTLIYLYYGNASVTESQEDAAGVWDTNYLAVWHMREVPTGAAGEIADSTANDVDSRTFNMASGDRISAAIGYGLDFDGVNQYIETPAGAPTSLWNRLDSALTVEAWARQNGTQAGWRPMVIRRRGTTDNEEWWLVKHDNAPRFGIQDANNVSNTETLIVSEWTHVVGAADNTAIRLYVDGTEVTNAPCTVTLIPDTNIVTIAAGQNPDAGEYNNIALDEIRVSDIARSAGWIATGYANQSDQAGFVSAYARETSAEVAWAAGYRYRKKLTIDADRVIGTNNLANYPALVSLTDDDLAHTTAGGYVTSTNGYDIVFTADDGTTQLDHELEQYTGATGAFVGWVRIPALDCDVDTAIYMYYGNAAVTESQENAEDVWVDYAGVWHLSQSPDDPEPAMTDSTVNTNDGTCHSGMSASDRIAGPVDGCLDFEGLITNGKQVDLGSDATLNNISNITVEAWVYADQLTNVWNYVYFKGPNRMAFLINDGRMLWVQYFSTGYRKDYHTGLPLSLDTWYHVAITYDDTSAANVSKMYRDGIPNTNVGGPEGSPSGTRTSDAGATARLSAGGYFDGRLDEVRVSTVIRSGDWIATCHTNQAAPGEFLTAAVRETSTNVSWKTGYWRRKRITIDADTVSGTNNLANFPALISLTDPDLATTNNGGHVFSADGYDILFTADDGATKLDHEVEKWTAATGEFVGWVRIPALDPDADTVLYLYYGNPYVSGSQENAAGVWDSYYMGVWHLAEDSGTTHADSSGNGNVGNVSNAVNLAATGIIDGADEFDNETNEWVDCGSDASLTVMNTNFTLEFWVKADEDWNAIGDNWEDRRTPLAKGEAADQEYAIFFHGDDDQVSMEIWDTGLGDWRMVDTKNTEWDADRWYYMAVTWDQSTASWYIDGANDTNASMAYTFRTTAAPVAIGTHEDGKTNWVVDGYIDEVRVSKTARSAAWLATGYTNMAAPTSFLSAASEESNIPSAAGWGVSGYLYRKLIVLDSGIVSGSSDLTNFPVLISLTDPDLAGRAHGGFVENASGYDIVFTADDGATQLDHEIELYRSDRTDQPDPSDLAYVAWVRVPVLSHENNTLLYLYFGNAAVTESQERVTDVWTNGFLGVWHLAENPTNPAPQMLDSSASANHGTCGGTMDAADQLAAQVDGGLELDGADDNVDLAGQNLGDTFTIGAWVYIDPSETSSQTIVANGAGGSTSDGFKLFVNQWDTANGAVWFENGNGSAGNEATTPAGAVPAGGLYHVALAADRSAGTAQIYVNGVASATDTGTRDDYAVNAADLDIGQATNGTLPLGGRLDEVRIANTLRSAGWLATCYTNQADPAAFVSVQPRETTTNVSWSTGWWRRKKITIEADAVSGTNNLANFPALVSLTDSDLATTANGGKLENANGYDLIFTDADGTTRLDHEVEKHALATGEFVGWVRIPALDCDADTVIYMYYGNPAIAASQEDAANVWDTNYLAVWHMAESPADSEPQVLDSTANDYDGTCQGDMDGADLVAARVGSGLEFDGSDDTVALAAIIGDRAAFTAEAWFHSTNEATRRVWSEGNSADNNRYIDFSLNEDVVGDIEFQVLGSAAGGWPDANMTTLTGDWHYVAGVQRTKSDRDILVDGAWRETDTTAVGTMSHDKGRIGCMGQTSDSGFFDGTIDELRISDIARSADWLATCYTNMAAPSDFHGTAAEESNIPVLEWKTGWKFRQKLTIDHDRVSGSTPLTDFPILISLTQDELRWRSYGGRVENVNGYDIVFTDAEGTTQLDHEMELYTAGAGEVVAWVRIPLLYPHIDTDIYMYYGNASIDASMENATNVWDADYVGVWHLKENPAGPAPQFADSTACANDGTAQNHEAADAVAGLIDGAIANDETNELVDCGAGASLANLTNLTLEAWVNPASFAPSTSRAISRGNARILYTDGTSGKLSFWQAFSTQQGKWRIESPTLATGVWQYIAATYDSTSTDNDAALYIDGVAHAADEIYAPDGDATLADATSLYIGDDTDALLGVIDEVRVSKTLRSADWLATVYTNQADPGGFSASGGEESVVSGWPAGYAYRRAIVIRADQVAGSTDLEDFPALISLADADLKSKANGGHVRHASGYDIVFTGSNGLTRLDHEIETYAAGAGELTAWVRVPVLAYDRDTLLYMYYGNPAVASSQENAAAVWDAGFIGVWHMTETAAQDSTTNAQHCTAGSGASVTA